MYSSKRPLGFAVSIAALLVSGGVLAQNAGVEVSVLRGTLENRPFTAVFPQTFEPIDDGSDVSVLSLQHRAAPLRCDVLVADGQAQGWTAERALADFDPVAVEGTWASQFPGFTVTASSLVRFQSGSALYYEGESNESPLGYPATIAHAEVADGGRTYIYECIMSQAIAADGLATVAFLMANFSTRSDGECCISPPRP